MTIPDGGTQSTAGIQECLESRIKSPAELLTAIATDSGDRMGDAIVSTISTSGGYAGTHVGEETDECYPLGFKRPTGNERPFSMTVLMEIPARSISKPMPAS